MYQLFEASQKQMMSRREKSPETRWLAKVGLVVLSIVVTLALFEIVLRNSVEYMPLKYRKYLPSDVQILAQNTKDGLVPESYVALLGDSYAAGWGDWFRSRLDDPSLGAPPFHSANTIHQLTGLNVLTFARPAQGSFRGIAYYPSQYFERLSSRGYPLPDPRVMIVYFYEGNDIHDNLKFLDRYWQKSESLTADDVETLVGRLSDGNLRHEGAVFSYLRGLEFLHQSYVAKFLYVLTKDSASLLSQSVDRQSAKGAKRIRTIRVRVNGEVIQIPGPVESPPVGLADSELARAVNLFESSLRYLMKHHPKSKLYVVYIPSPLMSYQLDSETAPVANVGGVVRQYAASKVAAASDHTCDQVADVASRLGAAFLDTRPSIRAVAREKVIHGPNDWEHFNETGYKTLGKAVVRHLKGALNDDNGASASGAMASIAEPHCAHLSASNQGDTAQATGPSVQRAD